MASTVPRYSMLTIGAENTLFEEMRQDQKSRWFEIVQLFAEMVKRPTIRMRKLLGALSRLRKEDIDVLFEL